MSKAEEWQSTDSGYLNCIGVGDTYVKKQIARILNMNVINAESIMYDPHYEKSDIGIDVWVRELKFESKNYRNENK